jgi:hypothetical protein
MSTISFSIACLACKNINCCNFGYFLFLRLLTQQNWSTLASPLAWATERTPNPSRRRHPHLVVPSPERAVGNSCGPRGRRRRQGPPSSSLTDWGRSSGGGGGGRGGTTIGAGTGVWRWGLLGFGMWLRAVAWLAGASARAEGSEVRRLVLLGGDAGPTPPWCCGWGLAMVHAGGAVVVLRAMPGFFQWRRCGGKEERATGLGKNMWQTWC